MTSQPSFQNSRIQPETSEASYLLSYSMRDIAASMLNSPCAKPVMTGTYNTPRIVDDLRPVSMEHQHQEALFSRLYGEAAKKKDLQKISDEYRAGKEMENCTFQPEIS
jgi:hypothetical protein